VNRLAPWLLAAAAVVAAGCAKNTSRPGAKLHGPQGVAVYRGFGVDQPGVLRPLLAVANTRGDDLRIIDAVTDRVLEGPTLVAALAVPTEPRPSLIAAGSLHDQSPAGTNALRSDLLVVAPRGLVLRPFPAPAGTFGATIELVVTWDERTRVASTVDLGDLAPEGALTSLLVAPVLESDGAGGWQPTPNQARVLATTTDGALLSMLATRDPADSTNAITLGAPRVQLLGFAGLDLALSQDGTRIYVATLDPIPSAGGVLGVAELDNTVAAGDLPVRALTTRIGTTQVAALDVAPFLDNDKILPIDPELDTFGPAEPRVYASLDSGSCGRDRSMPCGIAVIDPVRGGLAADPSGELPYQLPIQVPGEVVDFAVSGPPSISDKPGYLKFDPGSGLRWTKAFAAVSTTSGRIYLVDLSHFSVGNVLSPLTGSASTRVINSASYLPASASGAPPTDAAAIGLWYEPIGKPAALLFDSFAAAGVAVTPGYTNSETFTITYQGKLPGLSSRQAVAHVVSGAPEWIAIQEATGLTASGTSPWRSVARLYDPRLAVHIGDLVVVEAFPTGVCTGGAFELVVTALLPPDPLLYPGGAVAVTPATLQDPLADPRCLPQGADTAVTVSFRVPYLVLAGAASGYAGRPEIVFGDPESTPRFEFKYQDETALACPIMADDPQQWPPAAADIAACDAACRATCERLVLSRRARRSFYMTDGCLEISSASGLACNDKWVKLWGLRFPMPTGPVVAFKVGITDPDLGLTLKRGTYLYFVTGSGFLPGSRSPRLGSTVTGATAPYGVTLYDKSAVTGLANDGLRGFAAYADNLVLDFAPWSNVVPVIIR
jgi:hypothetical protein